MLLVDCLLYYVWIHDIDSLFKSAIFRFVQEATVLNYDSASKMIHVEYTEETMLKLKSQSKSAGMSI